MRVCGRPLEAFALPWRDEEGPLYRWIVDSETPPGRRIKTRHAMSEEDALAGGRNPVRIEPPVQWKNVPENEEERRRLLMPRGDR